MNPAQVLHRAGQSLWIDQITRAMLEGGTLARYAREMAITGLTSNPTIFDAAIRAGSEYDRTIAQGRAEGLSGERLFFRLALEDLEGAAGLFAPIHRASAGRDGWVSLELSPLLAFDAVGSVEQALALHARASLPNLFIKIPGTDAGLRAIEEATYAGVPVNVTLLFSADQYLAAADAYLRGMERRLEDDRTPDVFSVASLFVSRWDKAVQGRAPAALRNRLGIAVAQETYRAYLNLRDSPRWQRLAAEGVPPQRLLFASTGTKDKAASDTLYVEALVAPDTIDTMPEATLLAFVDHGRAGALMPRDGGDCDEVLAEFERAGFDLASLGDELQREGAASFVASFNHLLARIAEKSDELLGPPGAAP